MPFRDAIAVPMDEAEREFHGLRALGEKHTPSLKPYDFQSMAAILNRKQRKNIALKSFAGFNVLHIPDIDPEGYPVRPPWIDTITWKDYPPQAFVGTMEDGSRNAFIQPGIRIIAHCAHMWIEADTPLETISILLYAANSEDVDLLGMTAVCLDEAAVQDRARTKIAVDFWNETTDSRLTPIRNFLFTKGLARRYENEPVQLSVVANHLVDLADDLIGDTLAGFALCHAKNIVPVERQIGPRTHRERKAGIVHRVYELKINPSIVGGRPQDEPTGEGGGKPLHLCRGHFKDYRRGRGLFGRLKGLFWVPEHIRGNPDLGVVEKTYQAPDTYESPK